ncbi:LytR/AlgR family response regulator transcription factor [Flavobacterium sp. '19STA2R22 D10 B1']|uniref:LytR/AlgR family response regulator transcription factor n=1 Tax=Flavobacterium aerium TaxID=3037261 RepID=UPI00278C0544|nr:response regulator [Flavobacterium sp. '19STA2R22 D10 B1']
MNTKLKCLLLDDELPGLTYLKMLCEQIPELEIVKSFDNPEKLLAEMDQLDFDLCILDIEMPGIDGLSVANLLKDKMVIFTTAYKEYATDAFDIDAVDYITKPVKKERLQKAIAKAIERMDKKPAIKKFIQVNTDKGKALLFFDQILMMRISSTESRDKQVLLENGDTIVLKNITYDKLLKQLPQSDFCRVNKKEVIAMTAVKFFAHDEITTNILDKSGKAIALVLSDIYRSDFLMKVKV